jgi:LemA protein
MDAGWIVLLVVIVVVVIIPVLWGVATYNGFVRLRNLVQEAWRQIDVELHRRYDLIPNLIETVKGYAAHERAVFEEVTQARAQAAQPGTGPAEQARQEDMLSNAIGRLFAVAEAYPQLRAAENFVALQNELTNTEDRIAAGRRFYNANVRELNTRVETFPPNIIASLFKFSRAEYFEANDPAVRAAPRVSFQDTQGQVGIYSQGQAPQGHPGDAGGPSHGGQPGAFQPGQGGGQPGYPQQGGYQPPPPPQGGYQPPQG